MTITCPSCKTTTTILAAYIERMKQEGEPVRCPMSFCQHILIEHENEVDDGPLGTECLS